MSSRFHNVSRRAVAALFAAFLCAGLGLVPAQQAPDPAALAGQYATNAKKNAALMQKYTWKMRVELTVKGETKPAQLYQFRYDPSGKPQKTLLSAPPPQEPAGRGIRGRIKERRIEDFKAWADNLADLVKDYMAPTPVVMEGFYARAAYSRASDGTVQVSASPFLHPGDKATFWIDPETRVPRRFAFQALLGEDAVSGNVEFARVPGEGPQYAARVTIEAPSKKLTATVENFAFQLQ